MPSLLEFPSDRYVSPSDGFRRLDPSVCPSCSPRAGASTFYPRESHQTRPSGLLEPQGSDSGPGPVGPFYVLHNHRGQWHLLYYSARQPWPEV